MSFICYIPYSAIPRNPIIKAYVEPIWLFLHVESEVPCESAKEVGSETLQVTTQFGIVVNVLA